MTTKQTARERAAAWPPLDDERRALVEAHLRLAFWAARRMRRFAAERRLSEDALESAAMLGLVRAAARWEPSRGKFTTFAGTVIRHLILHEAERSGGGVIRVPRSAHRTSPLECSRARSCRQGGPGWAQLCEAPAREDDGRHEEAGRLRERVEDALGGLPERERLAVRLGLLEGQPLRAVGRAMGVTKERARQLRNRGLDRLRGLLADEEGRR